MKYVITESQYKNLFEGTNNFEREEKLINTLLSKFNYDGICGYDILGAAENKVSTVMIAYSQKWYDEDVGYGYGYLNKVRREIKQNLQKYLGLNNIYVGLYKVKECK